MLAARSVPVRRAAAAVARRAACSVHTEARIKELGITLPPPGTPKANYTIAQWEDETKLYVSGHLPIKLDGSMITGSVGPEAGGLSLEEAQEAARWCGLNLLATIQDQLGGDLDRVERVVKLFGIVSSKESFKSQHLVLNVRPLDSTPRSLGDTALSLLHCVCADPTVDGSRRASAGLLRRDDGDPGRPRLPRAQRNRHEHAAARRDRRGGSHREGEAQVIS